MTAGRLSRDEVLALLPQARPMRFVDEILELDDEHILATYTWKDEDCEGHFPGDPVVPGVKLIEMAAQVGSVAWCIHHLAASHSVEEIRQMVGLFTGIERGVFKKVVRPGETVAAQATFGESGFFRGNKLVSSVEIQLVGGARDGEEVFEGLLSGLFVPRDARGLR